MTFWSNFTFANTVIPENSKLSNLKSTKFCSHPFTDVSILWDGSCVPCCFDYDKQLIIGDANIDSIETIILNAKASSLRKAFLGGGSIPEYCQNCQADLIEG
ncbi:MAG: SPASM domain-containing protein [Magnetococcales bacterium]|nr:SPASM domain-containing protein [Magnetococcales bacterium]